MKLLIKLLGGYTNKEYKQLHMNMIDLLNTTKTSYEQEYDNLLIDYKKITSKYNTQYSRLYRGKKQITLLLEDAPKMIHKKRYLEQLNDIRDRLIGKTKRGKKTNE